jgi:hypothetical protein
VKSDSASVSISVRAETLLVQIHYKTCIHYCSRNREALMGELLGLAQD